MRPDDHLAAVLDAESVGLAAVLAAVSPKDAKAAGSAVRGYSDQAWAAARFERPSRWRGTNMLGFALMNVRDQLATSPCR